VPRRRHQLPRGRVLLSRSLRTRSRHQLVPPVPPLLIPVERRPTCPWSGRISSRGKTTIVYSLYNIINHIYTTTTAVHFHVPRSSPQDPRSQIQVPKLSHAALHAARRSAPTLPDAHATHCLSSTHPPTWHQQCQYVKSCKLRRIE